MAITANQKILTLDYWKRADQLIPGDIVFDRLGKPVTVTTVSTYRSANCYEVNFNDFLSITGDGKMGFLAEDRYARHTEVRRTRDIHTPRALTPVVTEVIASEPLQTPKFNKSKYSVQTTPPIQLPHQDLEVPPFVFGFWFANRKPNRHLTVPAELKDKAFEEFRDCGYKIKDHPNRFYLIPSIESQLVPNIPITIPNNYLMGSPEQRIALLRGLIYGKPKQYNKKLDTFRISTRNYLVFKQIQWLAEATGHKTALETQPINNLYVVKFQSKLPLIEGQESKQFKWTYARRFIKSIDQIPEQLCVHIETDGADNTVLVGEGFIACR